MCGGGTGLPQQGYLTHRGHMGLLAHRRYRGNSGYLARRGFRGCYSLILHRMGGAPRKGGGGEARGLRVWGGVAGVPLGQTAEEKPVVRLPAHGVVLGI